MSTHMIMEALDTTPRELGLRLENQHLKQENLALKKEKEWLEEENLKLTKKRSDLDQLNQKLEKKNIELKETYQDTLGEKNKNISTSSRNIVSKPQHILVTNTPTTDSSELDTTDREVFLKAHNQELQKENLTLRTANQVLDKINATLSENNTKLKNRNSELENENSQIKMAAYQSTLTKSRRGSTGLKISPQRHPLAMSATATADDSDLNPAAVVPEAGAKVSCK